MQINVPIDIFTYPDVPLPSMWTVEQRYDTAALTVDQIETGVSAAVDALLKQRELAPGASVCVGVGSRGVDNLVLTVRAVVARLKARGLCPFLIPAMGSHGGATAEGQESLLHDYGITPEAVGSTIRATMEVVEVGRLDGAEAGAYTGHPIYCDRNACGADAILLINRIKAHTDFSGPIESGIGKMSVIGLGKRHGAESFHRHGALGLRHLLPVAARFQAAHLPLLGGVALIENELGRTCEVHPLLNHQVGQQEETNLLRRARDLAPSLPFAQIDVLLIDEMGKNISGAGMDTHVIGRGTMPSLPEAEWGGPDIRVIAVLDLTDASHGNAAAFGLADLMTRRLAEKIDFEATYINMRTSGEGGVLRGRIPMILPTSEDCIRTAIATCGRGDYRHVRVVRIRNTADTQYLEISQALLEEAKRNPRLRVLEPEHSLDFCQPAGPV